MSLKPAWAAATLSTAEFLNLILGFGSTTVHKHLQPHQLRVGGRRQKTEKLDNSVIFPHQVLSCHREIALFGLPVSLPVLALWGRNSSTLCYRHPQKRIFICENSVRGKYNYLVAICIKTVFSFLYKTFHTASWSFAGPGQIKCNISQQHRWFGSSRRGSAAAIGSWHCKLLCLFYGTAEPAKQLQLPGPTKPSLLSPRRLNPLFSMYLTLQPQEGFIQHCPETTLNI